MVTNRSEVNGRSVGWSVVVSDGSENEMRFACGPGKKNLLSSEMGWFWKCLC